MVLLILGGIVKIYHKGKYIAFYVVYKLHCPTFELAFYYYILTRLKTINICYIINACKMLARCLQVWHLKHIK